MTWQERLEKNNGQLPAEGAADGPSHGAEDVMEVEEPPPSAATGSRARSSSGLGGAAAEAAAQPPPRAATTTGNNSRGSAGRSSAGRGLTQATLDFKRPASRATQPSPTAANNGRNGGAGASSSRSAAARGAARDSKDEMIDDDEDEDMLGDVLVTQMSGVRPRPARKAAAANKRKKTPIFSDDEISSPDAGSDGGDDGDFEPSEVIEIDGAGDEVPPARGGRRNGIRASAAAGSSRPQVQYTAQYFHQKGGSLLSQPEASACGKRS